MTEATFVRLRKFQKFTQGGWGGDSPLTKYWENSYSVAPHFEGLG